MVWLVGYWGSVFALNPHLPLVPQSPSRLAPLGGHIYWGDYWGNFCPLLRRWGLLGITGVIGEIMPVSRPVFWQETGLRL